jgi:hypothetical protein
MDGPTGYVAGMRGATLFVVMTTALLAPAVAMAAPTVRYVSTSGADNPTCNPAPCKTIQHAITVAQAGDTLDIGPGTFTEGELVVEHALSFVGAGAGTASSYDPSHDTLIDGSHLSGETIFDFGGGSFSNLRINGGIESGGASNTALYLQASAGAGSDSFNVSNVVATQPPPSSGGSRAAVVIEAVSPFTNTATITGLTSIGAGAALDLNNNGTLTLNLSHSTLTGGKAGEAALVVGSANATVSDTTATGEGLGAAVFTGGRLTATRDSFTGKQGGLKLRSTEAGTLTATLRDSLAAALPTAGFAPLAGALLVSEKGAGSIVKLNATNSTIVAYGKGVTAGLQLESAAGATATAQLANTIAYGVDPTVPVTPPADILAAGPGTATVAAATSAYSTVKASAGASITPVASAGNLAGNPAFVSPASGNFTLTAGSPLHDRGNPAEVQPGELDLAGAPRIDGDCGLPQAPDIGAYELTLVGPCQSPVVSKGPTSTTSAPKAPKAPVIESASVATTALRAHHRKRARAGKLAFTLNEAATVTVELERLASGHLRRKACVANATAKAKACKRLVSAATISLKGKAGRNTFNFPSVKLVGRLKAAHYKIVLVAISSQGMRSASRTIQFTLR